MRRAQAGQGYGSAVGHCQIRAAGMADAHRRHAGGLGGTDQRRRIGHRQHVARLVLAEPVGMAGDVVAAPVDSRAPVSRPGPFRRPRPAARRRRRRGRRAPRRTGSGRGRNRRCAFGRQIDRRRARRPRGPAISRSQSDWPSQPRDAADQHEVEPGAQRDPHRLAPRRRSRRRRRSPGWAGSRVPSVSL